MTRQLAAWHASLMIVCFALASLAVGALSDRIGQRAPLTRVLGAPGREEGTQMREK
jgi:MFS family permease